MAIEDIPTNGIPLLDFICVGAGPSNLSMACLLKGSSDPARNKIRFQLHDRRSSFDWHTEQDFFHGKMISSCLRDLVSSIEPTNKFSFINYLHQNGRLAAFLNRANFFPARSEFSEYMRWCAEHIKEIVWQSEIAKVELDQTGNFWNACARGRNGKLTISSARNLILGCGWEPSYGSVSFPSDARSVFHISEYKRRASDIKPRCTVAVIGGGQSSAEVVIDLCDPSRGIEVIYWIMSDPSPQPRNLSSFAREYYAPEFCREFAMMDKAQREEINGGDRMVGAGITEDLLTGIYSSMYSSRFYGVGPSIKIVNNTRISRVTSNGNKLCLSKLSRRDSKPITADWAIFATGFRNDSMLLRSIVGAHSVDARPDRSIDLGLKVSARLFVVNQDRDSFGYGDGTLAVIPGRAFDIINSMSLGASIDSPQQEILVDWFGG